MTKSPIELSAKKGEDAEDALQGWDGMGLDGISHIWSHMSHMGVCVLQPMSSCDDCCHPRTELRIPVPLLFEEI